MPKLHVEMKSSNEKEICVPEHGAKVIEILIFNKCNYSEMEFENEFNSSKWTVINWSK